MSPQSQVRLLNSDVIKIYHRLDGVTELISQSCGSGEVHQRRQGKFYSEAVHLTACSQDHHGPGREGKDGERERERKTT